MKAAQFIKDIMSLCKRTGDESKNLNNVHFNGTDGELQATDGHRVKTVTAGWLPSDASWLVPAKELRTICKDLKNHKGNRLRVTMTNNTLHVTATDWEQTKVSYMKKVVLGTCQDYPDIKQVKKCLCSDGGAYSTQDVKKGLKLARIMTTPRNRGIQLFFYKDRLVFQGVHPDLGFGEHTIAGQAPKRMCGQVLTVNANYLLQAIQDAPSETCLITSTKVRESDAVCVGDELIMAMKCGGNIKQPEPIEIAPKTKQPPNKKANKILKQEWSSFAECPGDPQDYTWIKPHERTTKKGVVIVKGHWRRKPHRCKPVKVRKTKKQGAGVALAA
jgi:hypothetical protein